MQSSVTASTLHVHEAQPKAILNRRLFAVVQAQTVYLYQNVACGIYEASAGVEIVATYSTATDLNRRSTQQKDEGPNPCSTTRKWK